MDIFIATQLSIPILQIALLLALSTLALIFGRLRLALLINYCFTLYWGYLANMALFLGEGAFEITRFSLIYLGFGVIILGLAVVGFIFHKN